VSGAEWEAEVVRRYLTIAASATDAGQKSIANPPSSRRMDQAQK